MSDQVYNEPSVRTPSLQELEEISTKLGLKLNGTEDLQQYQHFMKKYFENFNLIDKLSEPTLPVKYPRKPGFRPAAKDNPLNGWYWRTDIKGAEDGKLAGKTVAIKDNIAVAGVPMMNGCAAMEGYVPEFDASVVTRILDAGGHITGKSACESLCCSGSSFTSVKGTIRNHHNPLHSAGGSSGGSATLVASGAVDMAVGGDQGGSIRIPAAWCGIVGLKPTFGLVPYTGAMSIDPSVDHLGPMARTVHDCALLLEVLAGYDDGLDPRQPKELPSHEYSKEIEVDSLDGIKIGIIEEGLNWPCSNQSVNRIIQESIFALRQVGATVDNISIPMLKYSGAIWQCLACEGTQDNLFNCYGGGSGHCGFYPTSMMSFAGKAFKTKANDLSHIGKMLMLSAEYIKQNYPGQWYGKAQNLRRLLLDEYEAALQKFDVLAMPTVPFTAPRLPSVKSSVFDLVTASDNMSENLFAADLTGFPALSINVGFINGLPVGVQLESGPFQEVKILRVARKLELGPKGSYHR